MNIKRLLPLPVAAIAAILLSAVPGFAQSVLLTAGDFALLGGTAISVGGPGPNPITNGNVGLSPGAESNITGFPPATVSGNTLSGSVASIVATGGVTAQARADLITAQNALAAMASNTNLTNIDLGTVAPLSSGVYTFNAAAAQTGALVLDAQGQNGVFWVFQIGTSLTTSANSTVTFINLGSNGGTDNGLFWNAGAGITIGDNNTIVGNYLAGTSISFTGITTTLGGGGSRALALAGVSFAGPGAINPLGGPGGGDFDGGLTYNGVGALVPIGNVLLSSAGAYTQGSSSVVLVPGTPLNTTAVTIDGASRDGSGAASLTINSAAVTLTGTNTYTGGTIVNTGSLITSSANLPTNGSVTLNTSSLTFNQTATGTFGGVISGNGSVTKSGAGTLTVTGANTYSGGTTVSAGTLAGTTASLQGAIANNAAVTFDQTTTGTYAGIMSGTGSLAKAGTGTVTLSGTNTYTGATTVSAGTLSVATIGNGGAAGNLGQATATAANLTLAGGTLQYTGATAATDRNFVLTTGTTSTIDVANVATNLTVSGASTATTGALTKSGAGTLTLSGTNAHTGGTTVAAGTLQLGNSGTVLADAGAVTVNGGTLALGTAGETIGSLAGSGGTVELFNVSGRTLTAGGDNTSTAFAGVIQGSGGALVKTGTGTLTLTGANTYSGGTTVAAGTLTGDTTGLQGAIANNAAVTFNQATTGTYTGPMSGTGTLTKTGTGTVTLSGANTFTGGTTVSAGTLALGASERLADTGSLTVNGGTFDLGAFSETVGAVSVLLGNLSGTGTLTGTSFAVDSGTVSAILAGTGALTKSGTGTLALTGANTYTGGTTVAAGTLIGNTTNLQGAIVNNGTVTFNQTAAGTYAGGMSGTGTLAKSGAGTLTLTGTNTNTGGILVSAGTLVGDTTNLQGAITNNGAVTFNQTATGTYAGVMSGTGALTKAGSGTLTLTGANTATGGTTVSAGTLALSGSGRLGSASGALALTGGTLDLGNTNQTVGAVTFSGGTVSNGTLSGSSYASTGGTIGAVLAGSGVTFTNSSGTTTLTAANTYSGGTTVAAGTLVGDTTSLQGAIANNAAVTFNQAATGTYAGAMSGTGALTKAGAGTLTLTGANTYSGGTTVAAGTLVATTASLPTGSGVVVNSGTTLSFAQATAGTFTGNITGSGTLQKTGAGALTLANTTSTAANVQAGSLFFNGGLGATSVSAGALLGGSGTITGNLVNNGTVSPGFSPGTINVTGNFTQSSTGTLVIQLASATSFDKLLIAGTANLAGTVQIDTLGGFNPFGSSFTFLTAAGGVTGTFGTVGGSAITTGRAAISTVVTYAPTSVTVAFAQLPFAGFALTPNQRAVANGAQNDAALTVALDTIPAANQFPAALNSMSPQGYQIWTDAAFTRATALHSRLARNDGVTVGHDNFYFDASQRRLRAHGDQDVRKSTFTSTAELLGGDHAIDANLAVGAFLEHGKTYADLGSLGSRTTVKSDTLGGRAAWNQGTSFATASFGYSFDKYNSTRPVVIPGTTSLATSNTRGHQWFAGLTAGQHFTRGAVTLSPFGSLLASRWEANGFNETGAGIFNATVGKQTARSLQSQLGLEAELNWKITSVVVHPHVRAAWLHEFSNDARAINASFGPSSFAVATRAPQRDSALVAAGLDFVLGPRALLYSDVSAQSNGSLKLLSSWRVGVAVKF